SPALAADFDGPYPPPHGYGGQGRAGGEEQGAETGSDEESTSGHGGLGVGGRAGIAAIIAGGCDRAPEPPPSRRVG
ncbi:hypothetical protein SB3_12075, partial [Methylobacterium radiotolerans]